MNVSVIIPVKNRANLLPFTLDNILAQNLKPYEIVVVDDGSTDNILEVIKKYKSLVTFIKSNGKGPGGARNIGLKVVTGDAIQFFDSDDLMTKNKLQVQARLLQDENADFVYGPWVKSSNENHVWKQLDVIMQYYPIPSGLLADFVLQGWCNITQSALFSRELIKEVGLWREDLLTHEDYEYWFRIGKVANKYVHENKSCVIYRQHQHQVTNLQVTEKGKWLNELTALDLIKEEITFRPSLHSILMFKGKEFKAKSGFIKQFGYINKINLNRKNCILMPYFQFFNKMGRLQTGTLWQKMHGVLPVVENEFREYMSNI